MFGIIIGTLVGVSFAVGVATGRWRALALPSLVVLAAVAITSIDWTYERVSEEHQHALFAGGVLGVVTAVAGVLTRRLIERERPRPGSV